MARQLILNLFSLGALVCLATSAAAQAPTGSGSTGGQELEELYINVSFQIYVRGRTDYSGLYYFESPGKPKVLEVNYGQKSQKYDYRGLPEFTLFRIQPGIGEEPATYLPVASLDLTKKGSEVLMFLTPSRRAQNGAEFSLAAMESIRRSVAPGTVAFFNGTGATFQGVLAAHRLVIPPGLSDPISTSGIDTGEHHLLGLTVRAEGTLKVVLETNVRFVPNRRTLYVLMPPSEPDSFQINAFRMIESE